MKLVQLKIQMLLDDTLFHWVSSHQRFKKLC